MNYRRLFYLAIVAVLILAGTVIYQSQVIYEQEEAIVWLMYGRLTHLAPQPATIPRRII